MNLFFNFLLTIIVGAAGGFIFLKLKIPGAVMIGSIVFVSALNIFFARAYMPVPAKTFAQVIAGAFIGCSVNREDLKRLKHILKPAVILLSCYLIVNFAVGFIIYYVSDLDLTTSLFASVPGGVSDIPLIASDLGADAPKVAALQFVRLIIGMGVLPSAINFLCRNEKEDNKKNINQIVNNKDGFNKENNQVKFFLTIFVAVCFGFFGKYIGVPSGALVFSLVSVIVLKLLFDKAYLYPSIKKLAQVLAGSFIGCLVGYSDVLELKLVLVPAIILALAYSMFCIFVGKFLKKSCDMSLKEAMLTATPAGASDMALISSDMGLVSADLILLQVIRLVVVTTFFPQIINLFLVYFNNYMS